MKRLTPLVLALALVLFLATVSQAQPCPNCPNGVCSVQPSGPLFQPVFAVPCQMPGCAAGQCPCDPALGFYGSCGSRSCPVNGGAGGCPCQKPTAAFGGGAAMTYGRPYLFPRVRAFFEGRPRLFRRGCGL